MDREDEDRPVSGRKIISLSELITQGQMDNCLSRLLMQTNKFSIRLL